MVAYMIPLFTEEEYTKAKTEDKLPLQCVLCSKKFYKRKTDIYSTPKRKRASKYCSRHCTFQSQIKAHPCFCSNCGLVFTIKKSDLFERNFCSRTCSGTYIAEHKTIGTRRSKLEVWLEQELTKLYQFEIHFNRRDAIKSELDIYIPHLKLAFELNGIFHYEPIFGDERLKQVQNNDKRKFQACIEKQIEFCTIDTASFKYFKSEKARFYLDIICSIISQKIPRLTTS